MLQSKWKFLWKKNTSIYFSPKIALSQTAHDGHLVYMIVEDSFDRKPECNCFHMVLPVFSMVSFLLAAWYVICLHCSLKVHLARHDKTQTHLSHVVRWQKSLLQFRYKLPSTSDPILLSMDVYWLYFLLVCKLLLTGPSFHQSIYIILERKKACWRCDWFTCYLSFSAQFKLVSLIPIHMIKIIMFQITYSINCGFVYY